MPCIYSQTETSKLSDSCYRVHISEDWDVWGPNGGYVSAILLRAVGNISAHSQPVSIHVQYLSVAKFETAEVTVQCVKQGRSVSAFTVQLTQAGKTIATANVLTNNSQAGLEHRYLDLPETYCELASAGERPFLFDTTFWNGLEVLTGKTVEGHWGNWYRFTTENEAADAFADAARSLVLIDTMQWLAAYQAHKGNVDYMAPSLDLYVQFHQPAMKSNWLFSNANAQVATAGLVGGTATVWDENKNLVASGGSQSLCVPIPA